MRVQDSHAQNILTSRVLLARYLKGFGDANRTKQAPALPNHVAWNLGHLALTMYRAGELVGGKAPPAADFVAGERGDAQRFGLEGVAFGSKPVDDPSIYPGYARCVEIFDGATESLAAVARNMSDEKFASTVTWGMAGNVIPVNDLFARMVFHNGAHCGQIADLRRALGVGSIFS